MRRFVFVSLFLASFASAAFAGTLSTSTGKPTSARHYATWNALDANPAIVLSDGDLTAERPALFHDWAWTDVRASITVNSGAWYWETTVHYTADADVTAGVSTTKTELRFQPGNAPYQTDEIMSGPTRSGACFFQGGPVASAPGVFDGDVVRHWLDADTGVYRVAVNAGQWVEVLSGSNLAQYGWTAIAGLKQPAGSSARITANFGATPFVFDVPVGVNPGLYADDPLFGADFDPTVDAFIPAG